MKFDNGVTTFFANVGGVASMQTSEGCASISDAAGNLLFYTDGVSVWGGDHQVKIGNLNLTGNSTATQSAIIVPDLGKSKSYYIFTVGGINHKNDDRTYKLHKLKAAKIEVSSNSTWDHTEVAAVNEYEDEAYNNERLYFTERVTAVQLPDCSGFWVLTTIRFTEEILYGSSDVSTDTVSDTTNTDSQSGLGSNKPSLSLEVQPTKNDYGYLKGNCLIRAFKVTAAGVTEVKNYLPRYKEEYISISHHGYMRVSPDKTKVAIANGLLENAILLDFDVSSGTFSHPQVIGVERNILDEQPLSPTPGYGLKGFDLIQYGIEFSPDSKTLYQTVITHHSGGMAGYGDPKNATAQGFVLTRSLQAGGMVGPQHILVAESGGTGYVFGAIQLGPDGNLYIVRDQEKYIGRLTVPNNPNPGNYKANAVALAPDSVDFLGLPNLLPNPCPAKGGDCDCGCSGCNENAEGQNAELLQLAIDKSFDVRWGKIAPAHPEDLRCARAVNKDLLITPYFHFSWGDGMQDRIEEHDTEIVYITVSNPYSDLEFKGVRLTSIQFTTETDTEKMRIVPDRLVTIDCLPPCSSASREFALITRGTDIAGLHRLEVDYCIDEVVLRAREFHGKATFKLSVTED